MERAPEIVALELRAEQAGVQISRALAVARVAPSTYYRWREGITDPQTRTLRRVRTAIDAIADGAA